MAREDIVGSSVLAFIFQVEIIISNSIWWTYKGALGLQLYLTRDSGTWVFLWILRNFSEHLRATVSQRRLIPWCQKDVANLLFSAIWVCLVTAVKKDSINFWNNSMKTFIHMQNTNFIAHSFFEILHLKDSCNSWPLTWTICKIRCLRCITWVLILEYIQENIMTNFCKKKNPQKAGFLGHHGPISPSTGKNRLFLKFLLLPLLFFF